MTGRYRGEADALDREILDVIEARHVPDFDDLALRILSHQLRYNTPYSQYCAGSGVTEQALPEGWDRIPPVPAGAFKEASLCTFDPKDAFLTFETSGTTNGKSGKLYWEDSRLYDSSLLSSFEKHFLRDAPHVFRFLLLLPDFVHARQSSLSYMMDRCAECFGDRSIRSNLGWYLQDNMLLVDPFLQDARRTADDNVPVVLAGTAFAFVSLLDALRERGVERIALPSGSRIMETGGFKGKTRQVSRPELYAALSRLFQTPEASILAEYGMTELASQYYDSDNDLRQAQGDKNRVKRGPPWLRSYAVDENGRKAEDGVIGALVHVDLANRSSCVAIQTEDLGATVEGGIILLGRESGAELRGCSLDAESLRAAVS